MAASQNQQYIPRAFSGKQLLPSQQQKKQIQGVLPKQLAEEHGAATSRATGQKKKSAYLGQPLHYAEVVSNSTAIVTAQGNNYLSELECKSIEEAVAKEVLGDLIKGARGNKTTG